MPLALKRAVVIPTIKKRHLDPDVFSNYRPISNLSFISKVIEKCVYYQLRQHLTDNDLLSKN